VLLYYSNPDVLSTPSRCCGQKPQFQGSRCRLHQDYIRRHFLKIDVCRLQVIFLGIAKLLNSLDQCKKFVLCSSAAYAVLKGFRLVTSERWSEGACARNFFKHKIRNIVRRFFAGMLKSSWASSQKR